MSHSYSQVGGPNNDMNSLIDTEIEQQTAPQDAYIEPDSTQTPPGPSHSTRAPPHPEVVQPQIPFNPSKSHMFQISFYRRFFDLDTEQFFHKLQAATNPLNRTFSGVDSNEESESAELYGFIWLTGTLIFLMFVSSTGSNLLSQWIHSNKERKKYEYSFELLTNSIILFYGYNVLVPLLLFATTTWFLKFPNKLSLTKIISIYGYTNVLWFPITIVNFLIVIFISNKNHHLALNVLEWVIVILSGAVTGLSNISKLSPLVKKNAMLLAEGNLEQARRVHIGVVAALALAHLLFTVLVKFTFFGIKV